MTDHYEILGVKPTASLQAIKKAFRQKIKEEHPDLQQSAEEAQQRSRLVIQAYKILSNPESRAEYDRSRHFRQRVEERFDYREFLKARVDDLASQAKLIFFDLLHDRTADAMELYERLVRERAFVIERHLDREDYMDCSYLLSELLEERGELGKAYELLRRIAELELEKPYFKHFFYEVTRRLQSILCFKMQENDVSYHLDCLARAARLALPKSLIAQLHKKAAELYLGLNNLEYALHYLELGLKLDRRLKGAAKLKERLLRIEGSYSFSG